MQMLRCHENGCAEGTLECGSVSYGLLLGLHGGSFAAALQGASRIFMQSGAPQAHEICAQHDSANFSQLLGARDWAWLTMTERASGWMIRNSVFP